MPAIYTNELKKQVVYRVVRDRLAMSDVAQEFGVSYSNVYRWANDARYNEVDMAQNAVAPQDYARNNNNIRVIKGSHQTIWSPYLMTLDTKDYVMMLYFIELPNV